ncbi:thiamin pyrophosphokinase 1-like [Dreissena polymorpha]|uniref:Thiamine pyrophosphokinase n=1 Tax=Dreissena polymorpha TaxID=45954 RepID=A0A9D3Y2J3_DREPO|nr:thiamin pyrophosphokinase 1-like [Dreissena polymorpha]KAH3692733.1 hypothetical protein DPMN_193887 [Dreissena polymorpha]
MSETHWKLLNILCSENETAYALIVLNQPLVDCASGIFNTLWDKASFKAATDGATNHLFDMGSPVGRLRPDIITGDFDSVRKDVLEWYKQQGVEIVCTPDQDNTDFTKCLKIVLEKFQKKKLDCIIAFGAFGGRLDHMFANIDTLYRANQWAPNTPVYLMDNHNISCLLQKGCHHLDVGSSHEGDSCGLIPVSEPCDCVTTTGLKWNLYKGRLKFGELISTSNTWSGENLVTVETDKPLLWTMNIKHSLTE